MSGAWTDMPAPLPLDMRVLGALMVAHGHRLPNEFELAAIMSLPWLAVAASVDRLIADGVAKRQPHGLLPPVIVLTEAFTRDVAGCPRMGKVVAFPSGDAK